MKKHKVAYIEWIDSSGRAGWYDIDKDYDVCIIQSIGYLVSENDNSVTIAASIDYEFDNVLSPITIPKCSIKKRKYIKVT